MGNRLTLSREGRSNLEAYLARQAELAETTVERLGKTFSVDPAVHQKMENAIKESDELLKRINSIGVDDYSAAIFLIPICISFDTAEKRRYATYLILNRRFSFEF